MANKIPETFRIAFHPSKLSRLTPKSLTALQKVTLAKARIWGEIIGGSERTGLRYARDPFKGDSKIKYFDYSIPEFHIPFKIPKDEENTEIDEFREIRNARKGKIIFTDPKRTLTSLARYEVKRYLFLEQKRKAKDEVKNSGKPKK